MVLHARPICTNRTITFAIDPATQPWVAARDALRRPHLVRRECSLRKGCAIACPPGGGFDSPRDERPGRGGLRARLDYHVRRMGNLDAETFAAKIVACTKCERNAFEVSSYLERELTVMLGVPNQDGRWIHDDAKFREGIFRIRCIGCGDDALASADCPRCHRVGGLADALAAPMRLTAPRMCPHCKGTALMIIALVPARVRTGVGRPTAPTPIAGFRDPGFHVVEIQCEGCDWVSKPDGCPLCAGPLRDRPRSDPDREKTSRG
jgi:hypothetical protein